MSLVQQAFDRVRVDFMAEDVRGHLDTLKAYAAGKRVVEFGVYDCSTTWALLAGGPVWMRSYEIGRRPEVDEVIAAAAAEGIDWKFIRQSTLVAEIEPADVLYIDTLHTYAQLHAELSRHAGRISQHILMHDTVTFGTVGEEGTKPGLWHAIETFLVEHPEWRLKEHHTHCHGLTVLERM